MQRGDDTGGSLRRIRRPPRCLAHALSISLFAKADENDTTVVCVHPGDRSNLPYLASELLGIEFAIEPIAKLRHDLFGTTRPCEITKHANDKRVTLFFKHGVSDRNRNHLFSSIGINLFAVPLSRYPVTMIRPTTDDPSAVRTARYDKPVAAMTAV